MDQDTSEATFSELATALRLAGLGWIVDQVFESISEGKGLRPVNVKRPRLSPTIRRSEDADTNIRGNVFRRRVDFSPEERVILLAKALKAHIGHSLAIDEALTKHYPTIAFRPEIPDTYPTQFQLPREMPLSPCTQDIYYTPVLNPAWKEQGIKNWVSGNYIP
jgi:hypothetical protein